MANWFEGHRAQIISSSIGVCALLATSFNAISSYSSYRLNNETQKILLFTQLQQQFRTVRSSLPINLYDNEFRAAPGSEDYSHLRSYWEFCFVEWYVTNKLNSSLYGKLWDDYYSHRIIEAMKTPSLRAVLIDTIKKRNLTNKDQSEFYDALIGMAQSAGDGLDLVGTASNAIRR